MGNNGNVGDMGNMGNKGDSIGKSGNDGEKWKHLGSCLVGSWKIFGPRWVRTGGT